MVMLDCDASTLARLKVILDHSDLGQLGVQETISKKKKSWVW